MFKFDFVQDGENEQTRTAQNAKKEPKEPALTEISLIELVRAQQFSLLITNGNSFSWTLCPSSYPTPLCRYRHQGTSKNFLSLDGISLTRDFS